MKICTTAAELNYILSHHRSAGKKTGFVPTMGALHQGHISLIEASKSENDCTVCSIFVNPTQFNNPADLENYPRTPEADKLLLAHAGCDVLFVPLVEEMYPDGDFCSIKVDFGLLDKVMEGKSRPGHFAGMITIVNKLFHAVKPDSAYFGKKDFQQLAIIKYFVKTRNIPIKIRACATVREIGGLAMSSRNQLLSPEEKEHALLIPQTLFKVKELWGLKSIAAIKDFVAERLSHNSVLKLDYFEIVNSATLENLQEYRTNEPATACIAAYCGKVRLIDNVELGE